MMATRLTNLAKLITSPPANLPNSLLKSSREYYLSNFQGRSSLPTELIDNISNENSYYLCIASQLTKLFPELQKSKDSNVIYFTFSFPLLNSQFYYLIFI